MTEFPLVPTPGASKVYAKSVTHMDAPRAHAAKPTSPLPAPTSKTSQIWRAQVGWKISMGGKEPFFSTLIWFGGWIHHQPICKKWKSNWKSSPNRDDSWKIIETTTLVMILLMIQKSGQHHLWCRNLVFNGENWCRISEPSTVVRVL